MISPQLDCANNVVVLETCRPGLSVDVSSSFRSPLGCGAIEVWKLVEGECHLSAACCTQYISGPAVMPFVMCPPDSPVLLYTGHRPCCIALAMSSAVPALNNTEVLS